LLANWILIFLFSIQICNAAIPQTFHICRFEDSNYSQEEVYALKSWQECHPKWQFKIWTDSDSLAPPFSAAKICKLKNFPRLSILKKEDLKRAVLNQEGGVWICPDLICCKPIDSLATFQDFFISRDKTSLLGSEPGHSLLFAENLPERVFLSDSFIFPDQKFTTKLLDSPLKGVCFSKFKNNPPLNEEFKKIHSQKQRMQREDAFLLKKMSKIRRIGLLCCLSITVNGILLAFCFPYAYQMKRDYPLKRIYAGLCRIFSLPVMKYSLYSIFAGSLVFFNINKPNSNGYETENIYKIHKSTDSKYITKEDLHLLHTYNVQNSKHFDSLATVGEEVLIPHVIHVIWGGKNPFPQKSIANIASWLHFHPTWKFKFWTDDPSRQVPIEGMEKHLFNTLSCPHVEKYLAQAENWGERSDLLRYEILFQEGGIYVDHDIECFRSFDSLHTHFDFYASQEPLHQNPLKNSWLTITNCLIGAKPGHPILKATMQEIGNRWDHYSALFPDRDKQSSLLKTLGRTFDCFHFAFTHAPAEKSFIFPSLFVFPDHFPKEIVDAFKSKNLIFANHQWDNAWLEGLPESSIMTVSSHLTDKICSLSKLCKRILEANIVTFIALFTFLVINLLRLRKKVVLKIHY
jgi:mannosyltransferase OCH1-like enzyme